MLVGQLRQRNDLVYFSDRVEEGIPHGHGKGRLWVPEATSAEDDPSKVLAEAFSGGARTIFMVGDAGLARVMLAEDLIDQVVAVIPRTDLTRARHALTDHLPGTQLRLRQVTTTEDSIVIEAQR